MSNWKQSLVKVMAEAKKVDDKYVWSEILEALGEDPSDKALKKKIQDYMRTKEYKDAYNAYTKALNETKAAKTSTKKAPAKKSVTKTTTDNSTVEVIKPVVMEDSTDKNGYRTKSIEVILENADNLSPDDVMEIAGFDPKRFTLVNCSVRRGSWQAQSKDDGIVDMYSYRINVTVKPVKEGEVNMAMATDTLLNCVNKRLEEVGKDASALHGKSEPVEKDKHKRIAIAPIADLHLGKLAWAPECGESYDNKIAARRMAYIIDKQVELIKNNGPVDTIIFYWAQDFFHFDTTQDTTTAGTYQDSDIRWQKMFDIGVQLLVDAVNKLKEVAPVFTFYVRSNHDTQTAYYANSVLAAMFHNDPRVTVDCSPSPRQYYRFGCNLIGFAHGDKEGKRISSLMPIERPKDWGETWNHEFMLGHYHSLRAYEENGVVLRYLSSPTGPDAWHCESGFLGAKAAAHLFIRDYETGPVAEFNIPILK